MPEPLTAPLRSALPVAAAARPERYPQKRTGHPADDKPNNQINEHGSLLVIAAGSSPAAFVLDANDIEMPTVSQRGCKPFYHQSPAERHRRNPALVIRKSLLRAQCVRSSFRCRGNGAAAALKCTDIATGDLSPRASIRLSGAGTLVLSCRHSLGSHGFLSAMR